jgi:hypothetical protein
MPNWVRSQETSRDRAGFTQWYLCESALGLQGRIVGEVVLQDPDGVRTYYAELTNGKGLRYFTTEEDAKNWLWSFYILEKAA